MSKVFAYEYLNHTYHEKMLEFQSYHGNCILKLHPIYEFENFVNIAFFQCKKISQCYVDKHFFNVNRLGLKINFS